MCVCVGNELTFPKTLAIVCAEIVVAVVLRLRCDAQLRDALRIILSHSHRGLSPHSIVTHWSQ